MKVEIKNEGNGRETSTTLSWVCEGVSVSLNFPTLARPVYSEKINRVFVCERLLSCIYIFMTNGEVESKFKIPSKAGYQFRGLNKNLKSSTGVSLLFHPIDDGVGNKWGDIEQFELLSTEPYLGSFIDIYR